MIKILNKAFVLAIINALIAIAPMTANADDGANAIMESCVATIGKSAANRIDFSISQDKTSSVGSLTFSGKCFKMTLPEMTVWFDGSTQWTYLSNHNEVNVTEPTADELAESNPFELLRNYNTGFRCRKIKSTADNDIIELTPKSSSATYKKAVLTISKATKLPTYMELYLSNGTESSIKIKSITAVSPSKSFFTFSSKAYPRAEIIDLR